MPRVNPKKEKVLTPAQVRAKLASAQARERSDVLTELSYFGRDLCERCPHFREDHVRDENGRWSHCRICEEQGRDIAQHRFVSLYVLAKRFFASIPPIQIGGVDEGLVGVVRYGGNTETTLDSVHSNGGKDSVATTATKTRRAKPPVDEPDEPAAKPRSSKPQVANECLCGCGTEVKARFAPGHDARLKSRLINTALDPKATAKQRASAEKELEKLGWTEFLEKSRASREARAERATRSADGERSPAQKAATERMRAASKKRAAAPVEEDDEEDEYEDDDE